jgi:hypothetical protein
MGKYDEKHGESYGALASGTERSRPILHQHAPEIQPWGKIARLPIALDAKLCEVASTI